MSAATDDVSLKGRTLREHTARGTIINSAFNVGLASLGLLQRTLVAAFLTREEFGVWTILVTTLITLVWLKQLGIQDKYVQQREEDQEAAFQKAFTLELIASLAFFGFVCVALPLYGLAYDETQIVVPGIVLATSVIITAFQAPIWTFYRRMDFVRQRSISAADPVIATIVIFALAIAGVGYWSLVIGTVAGATAAAVLAQTVAPYRIGWRFDRATVRAYASFSWPLVGYGFSNLLVVQGTLLIGNRVVGLAGLGAVGLATGIAAFADRVDQVIGQTLYPAVARVAEERDKLFEAFVKSNRLALVWGMPFGVALALFADDLVTFVLGDRWEPAIGLIAAYGLIAAFQQVGWNWTLFFRAVNDTRPIFVSSVVNLVGFAVIAAPLIVWLGLPGFPIGFGAMTVLNLITRTYFLRRLFEGFGMLRHTWRAVVPSIPAAAVVLAVRVIPGDRPLARALAELALYVVATLAFTVVFERRLLREIWSYLRRRNAPAPAGT
ncbi:MAG: oligosaccharide flippase family protein [Actinomycetota bacterium]|nr:oligosaccharide flippase family protein [Actinomycetota bacterium]